MLIAVNLKSQEPDSATNARAVPIYATTVSQARVLSLGDRLHTDLCRASRSMILLMARGYSA